MNRWQALVEIVRMFDPRKRPIVTITAIFVLWTVPTIALMALEMSKDGVPARLLALIG